MVKFGGKMGIAALVCGIVSAVLAFSYVGAIGGFVLGIIAIVLGILGRKSPQWRGLATAGLVLGIIGTVLSAVFFVACIACTDALGRAGTKLLDNPEFQELKDAIDDAKDIIQGI
jgi:hypothetical protein